MKKLIFTGAALLLMTVSFTSCREEKTEKEELIEEMEDAGAEVKRKVDDGDVKIKMETEDKEVKIKEDADGDVKIKVENN